MCNILITGAAGFLGFHLQQKLNANYKVTCIDNLQTSASKARAKLVKNLIVENIESNFIDRLNNKPELVIHLAAETGVGPSNENTSLYLQQNVANTLNVLNQCRANKVKYFIYASSSSVYEPQDTPMSEDSPCSKHVSFYGTTKFLCEQLVRNFCYQNDMVAIGLRFFTAYGSFTRTDMAAYKFMEAISNGKEINLYDDGKIKRDFTHVSDIVTVIEKLIPKIMDEPVRTHHIFNVGSGQPTTTLEYASLIAEKLNKELLYTTSALPSNELTHTFCDAKKLENYIGFKPSLPLEEGITEMVNWYLQDNYN